MNIYLLRHGETAYNKEKRYQGQRDIPLSPEGLAALRQADFAPARVYISPLRRCRQTAAVLFPGAEQVVVADLQEMCFGSFEGRNYTEMEKDPDYTAWVAANCESPCPDGERKADFCNRICNAFAPLVENALAAGADTLVILAHGGTQMAVMERYAVPHKGYYDWCAPNGGGYLLKTDAALWQSKTLLLQREVGYAVPPKMEGN
ncbi:MAG: histidine phosphatase family protein [Gemmiger sp.]|nr:histidine phosphatase family protein [Gemmiger sp.]